MGIVFFVARGASFSARARGPVGHYMTFAGQLLLLATVSGAVGLMTQRRTWRVAGLATAGLASTALAGTFTRSSWLGLGAAAAVLIGRARPRWLPALGAVQTRRRARGAVIRLVDGLVGESLELGERGPRRRARVSHRIASMAAPIRAVEPPDDDVDLRFVAAVVRGNIRLLAGMVRANRRKIP